MIKETNLEEPTVFGIFEQAGATKVLDSSAAREKKRVKKEIEKLDTDELAKRFIADPSQKTFGPIYTRMFYGMRKFALRYVPTLDVAEEMTLVTFEKIWTKYDQFDPTIAKFSTWVYNILRYECLGWLNRKAAQNLVDTDINDLYASTVFNSGNNCENPQENFEVKNPNDIRMLSREEIIKRVYDISINEIENLRPEWKMAITEKLIKGKKLDEIAEEQNINVASAKNWLRGARLQIREAFQTKHKELYEMYLDVAPETGYLV